MENLIIQDLQDQIGKLRAELSDLSAQFYKNNFSGRTDFNKACVFNNRLKVPHYSTLPSLGSEVGDLVEVGGVLYICTTTPDTWTIVGDQHS